MKARYMVTNHPGVVVVLRVELDNGETASTTHGFQTVFEANEYCRRNLADRGITEPPAQTWENGCPTWAYPWVQL